MPHDPSERDLRLRRRKRPRARWPTKTHPMQHGHRPAASEQIPATLVPESGWHFLHLFYRVDRARLAGCRAATTAQRGLDDFRRALSAKPPGASGADPVLRGPRTQGRFRHRHGRPGPAGHSRRPDGRSSLRPWARRSQPTYSFYSITEVSEYVPDADDYARILREREGLDPESSMFKAKVASYAERLGPMNRQRLYPEFPNWPCLCFYPMSKMRTGDQNWYLLPFETRSELMSQHGRSGMKFAGRVCQVITASTGLDDWEWGVTLWARNPSYLKDIVYTMRFDESSARYALFGDFYFGYILPPDELLETIRL